MTEAPLSKESYIKNVNSIQSQNRERVSMNKSKSVVHEFNDMNLDESLNEFKLPDSIVREYNVANQNENFSDPVEKVSLKKSKSMINKYNINETETKSQYSCEQCDFRSKCKDELKMHIGTAHEIFTYPCDQCDYKSKQRDDLKTHYETTHESLPYTSDQCEYKSKQKDQLKMHYESMIHEYTESNLGPNLKVQNQFKGSCQKH